VTAFESKVLSDVRDRVAPDGSDVRVLLRLAGGSMAHFSLGPAQTSVPVRHRTVEEIWYVVSGHGMMWRSLDGASDTVTLRPGACVTIPLGAQFQFRSDADSELQIIGVTMPPWPLDAVEAVEADSRCWEPNVEPGPGLGRRSDESNGDPSARRRHRTSTPRLRLSGGARRWRRIRNQMITTVQGVARCVR